MLIRERGIDKYINQPHRESAWVKVQYGGKVDPENNFQLDYLLRQLLTYCHVDAKVNCVVLTHINMA